MASNGRQPQRPQPPPRVAVPEHIGDDQLTPVVSPPFVAVRQDDNRRARQARETSELPEQTIQATPEMLRAVIRSEASRESWWDHASTPVKVIGGLVALVVVGATLVLYLADRATPEMLGAHEDKHEALHHAAEVATAAEREKAREERIKNDVRIQLLEENRETLQQTLSKIETRLESMDTSMRDMAVEMAKAHR